MSFSCRSFTICFLAGFFDKQFSFLTSLRLLSRFLHSSSLRFHVATCFRISYSLLWICQFVFYAYNVSLLLDFTAVWYQNRNDHLMFFWNNTQYKNVHLHILSVGSTYQTSLPLWLPFSHFKKAAWPTIFKQFFAPGFSVLKNQYRAKLFEPTNYVRDALWFHTLCIRCRYCHSVLTEPQPESYIHIY